MGYRLSTEAIEDLDRIYVYGVVTFGNTQADVFYDGLIRHFEMITDNPLLSPIFPDREGYRRSVYKGHSIYYKVDDRGVYVVRILGWQNPYDHLPA